jgi:DNA-binding protein HU-beta
LEVNVEIIGKEKLVEGLALGAGGSKQHLGDVLDTLGDLIQAHLAAGDTVRLPGLGSFQRVATPARQARHPRTGAALEVPAGHRVRYRPAKGVR